METQPVDFRKERDFGSILNTTFVFIRQEFKPLLKAVMVYSGPFILLTAIATGYYQSDVFDMAFFFRNFQLSAFFERIFLNLALLLCASVLSYTMMVLTICSYIRLYIDNGKDGFELEDIGRLVARNFLKVFGCTILVFLMIGIGMIFCILPGVYLAVSVSLIYPVMIFGDKGFGNALSGSFSLTHSQWWWTLLLLLVVYLIVGIAAYVFTIPQVVLSLMYGISTIKNGADASGSIKDVMLILTTFSTFINSLLGVVPLIALSLQYFNIVCKKNKTHIGYK